MANIHEQVEKHLQEAQSGKEFKDIGRVANLNKTKAAYKKIDMSVLSELEKDEVQAFNMVKKDLVWPAIDVNFEKEKGVTSGAAYLKVKIRESVPSKPDNSAKKREAYVNFLSKLQSDLSECFTIEHITNLSYAYKKFGMVNIITYLIDPSFEKKSEEAKKGVEEEIKKHYKLALIYGADQLMKQLINEVFSKRFANMLFKQGDAALITYKEAEQYNSISEELSEKLISSLKERQERFVEANKENVNRYRQYSHADLLQVMKRDWQLHPTNISGYKQNPELFRDYAISYYERRLKQGIHDFEKKISEAKPREDDWSWFQKPDKKDKKESEKFAGASTLVLNQKEPLSYIQRTGGCAVGEVSAKEIVDRFGYKAVNYGNYVDDKWSKQHTKFYLQAMSDLGEMLNLNIKQLNEMGGLSIVFGGKGRKGHAATYYPQTKDINLTKSNGDGSVAHEYGHYFDNVLVDLNEKRPIPRLVSENGIGHPEIKAAFKELIDFFNSGSPNITPRLQVTFYAKDSLEAPTYSRYVGNTYEQVKVEIKGTIEETIQEHDFLLKFDERYYRTQLRVFGYIIKKFGLDSYELPIKLNTSMYMHKSAYSYFKYCYENPETKAMNIIGGKRTGYWTSPAELFARAWESVVLKKLSDLNRHSDYLVSGIKTDDIHTENYQVPYPTGMELAHIENLIDKIISVSKKAFNLKNYEPCSTEKEDMLIEFESKTNTKIEAGIDTVKTKKEEVTEIIKNDKVVEAIESKPKIAESGKIDASTIDFFSMGVKAHDEEKVRVPAQNKELMDILNNGKNVNYKSMMEAWLKGWDTARDKQMRREFPEMYAESKKLEAISDWDKIIGAKYAIIQVLTDRKGKSKEFQDITIITKVDEKYVHYKTEDGISGFLSKKSFEHKLSTGDIKTIETDQKKTHLEKPTKEETLEAIDMLKDLAQSQKGKDKKETLEAISMLEDLLVSL